MPNVKSRMDNQLLSAIKSCLKLELYSNAAFIGELLVANSNSEKAKIKVAEAYNGQSKPYRAYNILKNCTTPKARYKYALTCLKLNKYAEAERSLQTIKLKESDPQYSILMPAVYYTLATIAEKEGRKHESLDYYQKCLYINPMIWVAFEKMCKLSTTINVNSIFNENRIPVVKSKTDKVPVIKMDLNKPDDLKKKYQEFSIFNEDLKGPVLNPTQKNKISNIVQKTRFQSNSVINEDASKIFTVNTSENKQVEKKVKEKEINRLSQPGTSEKVDDVMQLFRQLGTAYTYQLSFNCAEAINIYTSLPKHFSKIGWVLSNLGKCYFEMVKYNEAEKTYSELLKLEPCRLEALDYYSTCLWHLKKQTELCWLSNHVLDTWLYSPEGWVAVGNCFSIQREHEAAIKFFQRAIQLNPNYAYAYTLCGHEFVSNEDFESGKKAYQKAISIDDKHYNAWWGYGNVCMKQEKYNDAIKYFKAAIEINDRSSVLYTYLGMAYFNNSMMKEAMDSYNKGESVDPKNPLTKFQKAVLLTSIGENKKALDLLLALCEIVPREAPVHILLGKLYNMQGNKEEAHKHFIMAMDLEPKNIASTKLLIDTIGINDVKMEDNEIL